MCSVVHMLNYTPELAGTEHLSKPERERTQRKRIGARQPRVKLKRPRPRVLPPLPTTAILGSPIG